MSAIEVSHVTKEYRLGALQSMKQGLMNTGARLLGRPVEQAPLFKALDDVSFSIEPGEVVGIIGHNGAGKSTLLKMLARISTPTHGTVKVNGRIAPLIEVGAGFVPDFTGRENVYLNGAILGMSKKEIDRKFDEIVDFAEIAEFIDTPVKRYSSGMQVKLAFAVATSIESEILIVDEVLAVGDLAFQRKCFDRMEDLIRRQGRTVLLVSHNIRQVERLCSRVLLLGRGRIMQDGDPNTVCTAFYDVSDRQIHAAALTSRVNRAETNGDITLISATMFDTKGTQIEQVSYGDEVEFVIDYRVNRQIPEPIFGIGIHTTDFLYLSTSQSIESITLPDLQPGNYTVRYRVQKFPFLPGVYSLRLGVALGRSFQGIFYAENVLPIHVVASGMSRAITSNKSEGFFAMNGEWAFESQPEYVDTNVQNANV